MKEFDRDTEPNRQKPLAVPGVFDEPAAAVRNLRVFAVPFDCGVRDTRMGAGPGRILDAGLAERLAASGSAVTVRWIEPPEVANPPQGEAQWAFGMLSQLTAEVRAACAEGCVPLVLGGPCYSAVGAVTGLGARRTGVIWFDAHGEFNTPETTLSGHLDGMGAAILTGRCWRQLALALPDFSPLPDSHLLGLGTRDLDPFERELMLESGATWLAPHQVPTGLEAALDQLSRQVDEVYVHIDPDALDESEGRGNLLSGPGGLTLTEMLEALKHIASRFQITGIAFASYDPAVDVDGRIRRAAFDAVDALLTGRVR